MSRTAVYPLYFPDDLLSLMPPESQVVLLPVLHVGLLLEVVGHEVHQSWTKLHIPSTNPQLSERRPMCTVLYVLFPLVHNVAWDGSFDSVGPNVVLVLCSWW